MTTAETVAGLPVQHLSLVDLPQLIASNRRKIEEYEQRYELASPKMAELIDRDAIVPSIEVINWYHTYAELKFLLETTPTLDTLGQLQHSPRHGEHHFVVVSGHAVVRHS